MYAYAYIRMQSSSMSTTYQCHIRVKEIQERNLRFRRRSKYTAAGVVARTIHELRHREV